VQVPVCVAVAGLKRSYCDDIGAGPSKILTTNPHRNLVASLVLCMGSSCIDVQNKFTRRFTWPHVLPKPA
jgi:hypothetical protein